MSERTRTPQPPITCNGCDATWTASGAAHCAGCHTAPFATVSLFDLHRSASGEHGSCLDPEAIVNRRTGERLMFFRAGMWRGPEMDEAAKVARFGERVPA